MRGEKVAVHTISEGVNIMSTKSHSLHALSSILYAFNIDSSLTETINYR